MLTSAELGLIRGYIGRVWDGVVAGRRAGLDADELQWQLALESALPQMTDLDVRDGFGGSLHRSNVAALWEEAGRGAAVNGETQPSP